MIKQEPNIPTQKLEYTTLMHSNLTPPSSASSTSSTSSNASSKKYSNSYLTHTSQPTTKRKLNDQKSNNIYNQKPIYSEYLSSKCLLYIYYKVRSIFFFFFFILLYKIIHSTIYCCRVTWQMLLTIILKSLSLLKRAHQSLQIEQIKLLNIENSPLIGQAKTQQCKKPILGQIIINTTSNIISHTSNRNRNNPNKIQV